MQRKAIGQRPERITHLETRHVIRCIIGLLMLVNVIDISSLCQSALSQTLPVYLQTAWGQWCTNSLFAFISVVAAIFLCGRLHTRWALMIALSVGALGLTLCQLSKLPMITQFCQEFSLVVSSIALYTLGVRQLPTRFIPIFFALILYVTFNSQHPWFQHVHLSNQPFNLIHSTMFYILIWWLVNHPFGKEHPVNTPSFNWKKQLNTLTTPTFMWLFIIAILTSTWLYAWNDPVFFRDWLPAFSDATKNPLQQNHFLLEIKSAVLNMAGTGAMLAGAIVVILASCRNVAIVAYAVSAAVLFLIIANNHISRITQTDLILLSGLLIGFKVLTYVLCAELRPKGGFLIFFAGISLGKFIISPAIILIGHSILQSTHSLLATKMILWGTPSSLLIAAFAASRLNPHERPKHLPAINSEWKDLLNGKAPLGTVFWIGLIIGFLFIFVPVNQAFFTIFIDPHTFRQALIVNILQISINSIYLAIITWLLIKNGHNTKFKFLTWMAYFVNIILIFAMAQNWVQILNSKNTHRIHFPAKPAAHSQQTQAKGRNQ